MYMYMYMYMHMYMYVHTYMYICVGTTVHTVYMSVRWLALAF